MNTEGFAEQICELTANIKVLAYQIGTFSDLLAEHGKRILALETVPARRWDDLVKQLIGIAVAGAGGAIVAKIFLGE